MTRGLVIPLVLIGSLLLAGCGNTDEAPPPRDAPQPQETVTSPHHTHGEHEHPESLAASEPLPGHSIYHLDNTWQTHRGEEMQLADLRGRPVVVVMIYANCDTACPILIRDALRLEGEMAQSSAAQTQFVMITLDPRNDAPETLAAYVRQNGLERENWHFLTAPEPQTRAVATLLGVQYRPAGNGMISHTNLITVLDSQGQVALRVEGLGQPMDGARAAIEEALEETLGDG